LDHTIAP